MLRHEPAIFVDDSKVMVELGLGKNMVRSARFWAQTMGVISISKKQASTPPFGTPAKHKSPLLKRAFVILRIRQAYS